MTKKRGNDKKGMCGTTKGVPSENNLSKIIFGKEIEFRIFNYIRGIRKGLKLLFSCFIMANARRC
ncbi:MAG TPA: hypothetical protein PLL52_04835 [Caldisericia bacterium]|nr:hypothetical protein [Caldisericia bacterium]